MGVPHIKFVKVQDKKCNQRTSSVQIKISGTNLGILGNFQLRPFGRLYYSKFRAKCQIYKTKQTPKDLFVLLCASEGISARFDSRPGRLTQCQQRNSAPFKSQSDI
ncbi:MAG: hypothetical protein A3A98_03260 [Candidatus Staskawiczbacteria bacterium RIFCSPLOWO2_01_FULL_40_39]|nr:MAG: hypothetical protein A3A98_03260 [Candidatus Staskawiczbacteria bacterium RIFCSPLOWO2_01_FULL_40_39]